MSVNNHFTDMSYAYDSYSTNQYPQSGYPPPQASQYPGAYGVQPDPYAPTGSLQASPSYDNNQDPYADERPLMEELGINLDQIMQKTWAVLSFKNLDDHKYILHETDLAGPLVFLLAFGTLLLFTGKIQFGYVFGLGTLGCLIIYLVVYLMAPKNISFFCTVSVLGYCLLPMVILSALSILINLKISLVGNLISVLAILWCAFGASNLFATAIEMSNSRILIAYPCMLFYTVFALLTVF